MIGVVRDYFRGVIATVDSDLREHDSVFVFNDIPENKINDTYFIFIGSMDSNRVDTFVSSTLTVDILLFKSGYNDAINNYDLAYDCAVGIQSTAMQAYRFDNEAYITDVRSIGIQVDTLSSNDNAFSYRIQFQVELAYQ